MYFYDWTMILMLPGLLLGLWAQWKVKSAFARYSRVPTRAGVPAGEVARHLLVQNGNTGVTIRQIGGELTDHYDPRDNSLSLSQNVYGSSSVAALGVAAHEAGHAMQKQEGYPFLKLRTLVAPVVNIGSNLSWPIFLAGLVFSYEPLMNAGIILFAAVVVFALITLPVEFDASRRALRMLTEGGFVTEDERQGAKAVLTAAALTYVAAMTVSLLQFLRLLSMFSRRRE